MNGLRGLVLISHWKQVLRDSLRARVIRTHDLPRGVRALVILGYASVVLLLAATLLFELLDIQLPTPGGPVPGLAAGLRSSLGQSMPYLALAICSLSTILGWALVLTGASDCRSRVFVPVVGLFVFELLVLSISLGYLRSLWLFLLIWFIGVPTAAHFFTARFHYWRDLPLLEFSVWFVIVSIFVGFHWLILLRYAIPDLIGRQEYALSTAYWHETVQYVIGRLDILSRVLALLTLAFWTLLGVELADIAISLARQIVARLRRARWESALRPALIPALYVQLLAEGLIISVLGITYQSLFFFINLLLVAVLVLGPTVGLVLARCWTDHAASTLLTLNLALLVFSLGLFLILTAGKDFEEAALAATGLFPPTLLFVFLTAYNVMNFGVAYANRGSPTMPRTGRVLLYFGSVILVCTYILITELEPQSVSWQSWAARAYWEGALYLGLPYLVWLAWRSPQMSVEHEPGVAGTLPPSISESPHTDRLSGIQWAAAGIYYGLLVLGFDVQSGLAVAGAESTLVNLTLTYGPSPLTIGPCGIIFGIIGYQKGARRLGMSAIIVGAFVAFFGVVLYVYGNWLSYSSR